MVKEMFSFFLRLVKRNKFYYGVLVFGLAISLASFLLISLFIQDELSYDKFHVNADRIYRLTIHLKLNGVDYNEATSQFPAATALEQDYTGVQNVVQIFKPAHQVLELGDTKFKEENFLFADESFFRVFSFDLLKGERTEVLKHPNSVVLTETAAKKYFGEVDPFGKEIKLSGKPLIVTGIAKDVPRQSHIKFDMIVPLSFQFNSWKERNGLEGPENKWFWTGAYNYILFKDDEAARIVETKLPDFAAKYFPDTYKNGHYELQPLGDIHLKSHLEGEIFPNGDILYVRLFLVVALVILIVSAINLANLSYFKISGRFKEIGARKFLGLSSRGMVVQLVLETLLTSIVIYFGALGLAHLFMKDFNLLVNKDLSLVSTQSFPMLLLSLFLILTISILSVLRPALRYSFMHTRLLLATTFSSQKHAGGLRNILIGIQLCCAFVLLSFSIIISDQITFLKEKDLGFNPTNLIKIGARREVSQNLQAFRDDLLKSSSIQKFSVAETSPGHGYSAYRFVPEGRSPDDPLMMPFTVADYDFVDALQIKIIAGENFNPIYRSDSFPPLLINQKAANDFGWKNDALGRTLEVFAPGTTQIMLKGKVIGVIEDYHFESLHTSVKPLVITYSPFANSYVIRVADDKSQEAIAYMEEIWNKFAPGSPFEYTFVTLDLAKLYSNEQQLSEVIRFFTWIGLFLTCYGLFTMSSLYFSSKLKEVTIRKVFGANQKNILSNIYGKYALFKIVSMLTGIPILVYVSNFWLQNFQYRISLSYSAPLKAAMIIFIAGIISASFYMFKVVMSNPIKYLRNE